MLFFLDCPVNKGRYFDVHRITDYSNVSSVLWCHLFKLTSVLAIWPQVLQSIFVTLECQSTTHLSCGSNSLYKRLVKRCWVLKRILSHRLGWASNLIPALIMSFLITPVSEVKLRLLCQVFGLAFGLWILDKSFLVQRQQYISWLSGFGFRLTFSITHWVLDRTVLLKEQFWTEVWNNSLAYATVLFYFFYDKIIVGLPIEFD